MTQYIHQLVLTDGEMIALKAALDFYAGHCKKQEGAPYLAHEKSIQVINSKITANYERLQGK